MFRSALDVNNGVGKPNLVRVLTAIRSLNDADTFVNSRIRSDGTFNCYLGEEITINDGTYNAVWQVVGVDTELGKGDTPLTQHHISLVPKTILTLGKIHSGKCNGYANSDMHLYTIPSIVAKLEQVLGDHLLERRIKLTNATSSTRPHNMYMPRYVASGSEYYSVKANLMCQLQVFGNAKNINPYDTGYDTEQLPGFKTGKVRTDISDWWWLRDIYGYDDNYYYFWHVFYDGTLNNFGATISHGGIRPLITIG